MKGYAEVDLYQFDYPFDCFKNVTPVAIEIVENSESLPIFEHPENPLYVFGPEDGGIKQTFRKYCHRFVSIPTRHCTNLSAAVYIILYDRLIKRVQAGLEPVQTITQSLRENRGYWDYQQET